MMMDESRPLLPDENLQHELSLQQRNSTPTQPYGMAALLLGITVLLVLRLIFRSVAMLPLISLGTGLLLYQVFLITKPRLPLLALAVVAAELGLLLSLPSAIIFGAFTAGELSPQYLRQLVSLVMHMIAVGVIGAFVAWALSVERYPTLVLGITFLAIFVVIGLLYPWLPV